MIHPDDEQGLQRILRTTNVPKSVIERCARWTRAYHGAGHSGPLGTIALIALTEISGVPIPEVEDKPQKSNWSNIPANTRVEAHFFGLWQPATYLGLAPNGALAVRLDSDSAVRECYPHVVRLPGSDTKSLPAAEKTAEKPATMKEAIAEVASEPAKKPEAPAAAEPAKEEPPPKPAPFDWLKANRGDLVWAERDDDYANAKFDKIGKASSKTGVETLLVVFEGDQEVTEVPVAKVTLAS